MLQTIDTKNQTFKRKKKKKMAVCQQSVDERHRALSHGKVMKIRRKMRFYDILMEVGSHLPTVLFPFSILCIKSFDMRR